MEESTNNKQAALLEKTPNTIEQQILQAEEALDIRDENDRLVEASLFIDKTFLSYTLITGVVIKPERIFGSEVWADYLDGRVYTRQYGRRDLTPDFIINLHKKLTQRTNSDAAGKIRDRGVLGASYDDPSKPVTYTPEQVKAIEENPRVSFKRASAEDQDSTTGFLVYPYQQSGTETQEAIKKDLDELCEWFNNAKKQDSYDPVEIAALLQHRLVSLHPFLDINGTLTRVLMNWSLENDGEAPSVIDNPGEDILIDEKTWVSNIKKGSKLFIETRTRQAALHEVGIDNINALFNLGQDKAFYEYIFRYLKQAPPLPTNGDKHNHQLYEDFLTDFKNEMNQFQEYMGSTSVVHIAEGDREISQGGLITLELMQLASIRGQEVPAYLRELLFSDVEVYRGGMIEGGIDDEKICQMFQNYTGVGTGYRALQRSHLTATSSSSVNPQVIEESMDYYNRMIAASYFAKKHSDVENPHAASVRDLETIIRDHVGGGKDIWNSPFASTSLNYYTSRGWAERFWADYAKNVQHGVLLKARVPKEGVIMTFGSKKIKGVDASGFDFPFEREVLVAAGLMPSSISEIEVFDEEGSVGSPSLTAKRVKDGDNTSVIIEDCRAEFIVIRTYVLNPATSKFEFSKEEKTDTPSPRKEIPMPIGAGLDLSKFIIQTQKIYDPPFKIEIPSGHYSFINQEEEYIINKIKDYDPPFLEIPILKEISEDKYEINLFDKLENLNIDYLKKNIYKKTKTGKKD